MKDVEALFQWHKERQEALRRRILPLVHEDYRKEVRSVLDNMLYEYMYYIPAKGFKKLKKMKEREDEFIRQFG